MPRTLDEIKADTQETITKLNNLTKELKADHNHIVFMIPKGNNAGFKVIVKNDTIIAEIE
jgi:hypothetical protein